MADNSPAANGNSLLETTKNSMVSFVTSEMPWARRDDFNRFANNALQYSLASIAQLQRCPL